MTALSLAARARRLIEHLDDVTEREQDEHARTIVESVSSRAQVCHDRLSAIMSAVRDLRSHKIDSPRLPRTRLDDVAAAKQALRATATKIERMDPRTSAERARSQSVDNALGTCEQVFKTLQGQLVQAAERRRQQLLPPDIESPVLGYPGVNGSLVVRLQNIQRALLVPLTDLRVDQLVAALDKIAVKAEQWTQERPLLEAELEKHHPEIKEFLRLAATDEGAPWSAITQGVSEWLSDPANTADLKVVLRQ